MSTTCPNCSAAIDKDAVFCTTCGKPVSQTILCPKCRGTNNADAKFCKFCAFDLSQTVQTSFPEPPPIDYSRGSEPPTVAVPPPIVIPAASAPSQSGAEAEDKRSFITPSAAGFAIICFFLPWIEYSCGGFGGRSLSGSDLASVDSSLWLIPLAAAAIIGAFFYFRSRNHLLASIPVTMGAVGFALTFLVYKMQIYGRGIETPFGGIGFSMAGFSLQFGGFLAALSFLAAWAGCFFLLPPSPNTTDQTLSPNKAAAFCYLLFPLPYFLWLIAPLVFIFKEPYKSDKFIRFHAFQAGLLGLLHIAASIVLFVLFMLFDLGKPAYARGEASSGFYLLSVLLSTGFIALAGFLAYKTTINQTVKLSYLGDWATTLVDKDIQLPNMKS